jgi:WD40 repeat protein
MAADPTKLKKVQEHGTPGILFCVARAPESETLYAGSSDFKVYRFDLAAEKVEPKPLTGEGHQSYVTGVALAGEQRDRLVSGSYDGRLIWWDVAGGEQKQAVEAHGRWIRQVIASPDGKTVASVADDMVCKLWDAATAAEIRTVTDHQAMTPHHYPSMLYAAAFSADGRHLATGDRVGHVAVWDTTSGEKLATLEAPIMYTWDPKARRHSIGGIRSLAFSPDGTRLAVGGIGTIGNIDHLGGPSRVEIFDWQSGERRHEIEDDKHKGLVEYLEFGPDGKWLLATGGDNGGFVTFHDAETGKLIHQDKAPMHVHAAAFNESCEKLYTVGHGKVATWELTG